MPWYHDILLEKSPVLIGNTQCDLASCDRLESHGRTVSSRYSFLGTQQLLPQDVSTLLSVEELGCGASKMHSLARATCTTGRNDRKKQHEWPSGQRQGGLLCSCYFMVQPILLMN